MTEINENDKPQANLSFAKDKILLVVTGIFLSILIFLPDNFEPNLKLHGILLLAFIAYFSIRQILEKRSDQSFDFAKLLKDSGFSLVALIIGYSLFNLDSFINKSFSINFYFSKILSFLMFIAGFVLMLFTFHTIEKHIKK